MAETEKIEIMNFDQDGYLEDGRNLVETGKLMRDLADKVRSGVIDQIGTQSRGTQSCNFYVVKHTDMPATLVEVAFISNETEEKLMDSEEGIRKAAQGIADGIADYFG